MALTGFNAGEVEASINAIKGAYSNLIDALGNQLQTQFVDGMAPHWACKDAQDFYRDIIKESFDQIITSSNNTFQSVVDSMNSAATSWANQTGNSGAWTPMGFDVIDKKIDVGNIQENINGARGIDETEAKNVAAKLPGICENAKNALQEAQNGVSSCGFLGGGQAGQLQASLASIKSNIESVVESATTASKSAIDKTVEQYGSLSQQVTTAFNGN